MSGDIASCRLSFTAPKRRSGSPIPISSAGSSKLSEGGKDWRKIDTAERIYGRPNWPPSDKRVANYRGLGLAEMATAIAKGREPRVSGAVALHVLDAMMSILKSAETGKRVRLTSPFKRPPVLSEAQAAALLK